MKQTALQKSANAASWALSEHRHMMREEHHRRMREAKERIDREIEAEFGDEMRRLQSINDAAEQAELEERERLSAAAAPYPVGTKMCGWEDTVDRKYGRNHGVKPSWKLMAHGIAEVITRDSVHPGAGQSKECVGTFVVRLLKKDGTPSMKYQALNGWRSLKWLPEGETPKGSEP